MNKPDINTIAINANEVAAPGHEITAGYIGDLEWSSGRDDRSWRFFKSNGHKCESWPYGGMNTAEGLAQLAIEQADQLAAWVQAPIGGGK